MSHFNFNPIQFKTQLRPLLRALIKADQLTPKRYHQLLRRHPKTKTDLFSKSEVIAGLRRFYPQKVNQLLTKLQMKPVRTLSGVVPVTLLTKPYPCPGKCIFCPNDPAMPKSYLSAEPGAQRAAQNRFDPFNQVITRLQTYYSNGHVTDKVELIVLGGTWSVYPSSYKIWFIKRCFDALNAFQPGKKITLSRSKTESATWQQLTKSQRLNHTASSRCVGLSLETRPDFITHQELINYRRLGCTKVQIGLQTLSNRILKLNLRGHTIKESRQAVKLLRQAGFKIQAHWMANLYGSNLFQDLKDFQKLFSDLHYRPDELKIYPCSLIDSAPLMKYYQRGLWQPYTQEQLLELIVKLLPLVSQYCRVSRVIRDFSSQDIVAGNKTTNLRQLVEKQVLDQGKTIQEIRFREIRRQPVKPPQLSLKTISYTTSIGQEKFLQFVTHDNRIAAFLRLSLPQLKPFIPELNHSALIREIHVYGQSLPLGEKGTGPVQHLGLGTKLINQAAKLASRSGYRQLSVISAIGTQPYYRQRGFKSGKLYQHLGLK